VNAAVALSEAVEGLPRLGPALSATTGAEWAYNAAQRLHLQLWPWQSVALHEGKALNEAGRLKYYEVAAIASRRNGKTKILDALVLGDMDQGRRVLHTSHNRILPRKTLFSISNLDRSRYKVREANGQEEITDRKTGGSYKILAPQRGARGEDGDTLVVDEVREFEDWDFIAAAEPIVKSSDDPQVWYLSNAGSEKSVVLNDLKRRAESEFPRLLYMEWSASPELAADDHAGWLMANPSIGYGNLTIERLQETYDKYLDSGEQALFETEHLCRWVVSMMPRLVLDTAWQQCRGTIETPRNPSMGISVDPNGRRASAVIAWPQSDGSIAVTVSAEVTGNPINIVDLAVDLTEQAQQQGVTVVGFDPWTDQHLARHFPTTEGINGQEFANASERFVSAIETQGLRWQYADSISSDLPYVSRKVTTGRSYMADRADPDRSITAALAAVRAVWLASNPQILKPAVY
jgi:hypothetical protein